MLNRTESRACDDSVSGDVGYLTKAVAVEDPWPSGAERNCDWRQWTDFIFSSAGTSNAE